MILYPIFGIITYFILIKVVNSFLLEEFTDSELESMNSFEGLIVIVLLWPAFVIALILGTLDFLKNYITELFKF